MSKCNYHTHTTRCMHAIGSDEEYVLAAIKAGFTTLGFSDHAPWNYKTNLVSGIRMKITDFDNYYESINKLKIKYASQIKILIGLECEYFPEYMEEFKAFLTEKKVEYIIFGNHFMDTEESKVYYGTQTKDLEILEKYKNSCIEGMKTGIYSYLAHPDLFMRSGIKWDENTERVSIEICEAAKKYNIPLEYNLQGLNLNYAQNKVGKSYPLPEFFQIAAKIGNDVIIGVDAHEPSLLADETLYKIAQDNLSEYGCNVVEDITIRKW